MKILFLSHSQKLGGAERVLCEVVKGLVEKGHKIWVVIPSHGEIEKEIQQRGGITIQIPYRWWAHDGHSRLSVAARCYRAFSQLRAAFRIASLIRSIHPDVVITNTLTIPAGAIAAKLCRKPHIWYIHEFGQADQNLVFNFGNAFSFWLMGRLSDRIIANSKCIFSFLEKRIPTKQLSLLYQAVEVPRDIDAIPIPGHFKLLIVGQITEGKRQHEAINALKLLLAHGLDIDLTLIGSEHNPAYSRYIRDLISEADLAKHVHLLPFTLTPLSYMKSADAVLVCSSNEAFGRVTIEAMKLAKPVVGAKAQGTAELINDGVTGLLYESGNIVDLAEKIKLLYRDPAVRSKLSANARDWALKNFNHEISTNNLLKIICQVVVS